MHINDSEDPVALFAKYNQNNQVKEDEVGGACSPNGGKEKCV
jgi:hypothetical protein